MEDSSSSEEGESDSESGSDADGGDSGNDTQATARVVSRLCDEVIQKPNELDSETSLHCAHVSCGASSWQSVLICNL